MIEKITENGVCTLDFGNGLKIFANIGQEQAEEELAALRLEFPGLPPEQEAEMFKILSMATAVGITRPILTKNTSESVENISQKIKWDVAEKTAAKM